MKTVREIELVFENCDSMTIPEKHIGFFEIDDIRTRVRRIAVNAIAKMELVGKVVIEILPEGNTDHFELGVEDDPVYRMKKFERVRHNDITSIEIHYDDDSTETYYPEFEGTYVNEWQTTFCSKTQSLYVLIGKNIDVKKTYVNTGLWCMDS